MSLGKVRLILYKKNKSRRAERRKPERRPRFCVVLDQISAAPVASGLFALGFLVLQHPGNDLDGARQFLDRLVDILALVDQNGNLLAEP